MNNKRIIICAFVLVAGYSMVFNSSINFYKAYEESVNREPSVHTDKGNEWKLLSRPKRQLQGDTENIQFNATFIGNDTILVEINFLNPTTQTEINIAKDLVLQFYGFPNRTLIIHINAELITTPHPSTTDIVSTTQSIPSDLYTSEDPTTETPMTGGQSTVASSPITDSTPAFPKNTSSQLLTTSLSDAGTPDFHEESTTDIATTSEEVKITTGTELDEITTTQPPIIDGISTTTTMSMNTTMADKQNTEVSTMVPVSTTDVSKNRTSQSTTTNAMLTTSDFVETTFISGAMNTTVSEQSTVVSITATDSTTDLAQTTALHAITTDSISSTSSIAVTTIFSEGSTTDIDTTSEESIMTSTALNGSEEISTSQPLITDDTSTIAMVTTGIIEATILAFEIPLANRTFSSNLSNSSSEEYMNLTMQVESALSNTLTLNGIRNIQVVGFREGSVICRVEIEADNSVSEQDIIDDYRNSNATEKSIFAASGLKIPTSNVATTSVTNIETSTEGDNIDVLKLI
uniref:serine-rich adhesin for platelets-like n=1 Tax=Styela clava TaxID=7725 RepID=UPI001939DAC1|nr:serine-rich adhesin for platelets-like [Styela clava]